MTTDTTGSGMADLLADLHTRISFDQPAYVELTRLLTLDGRVQFRHAVAALTEFERAVLHRTLGDETLRLRRPDSSPSAPTDLLIGQSAQGRLTLRHPDTSGPAALAVLPLPDAVAEEITEEVLGWQLAECAEQARLDALLGRWQAAGVLPERVRQVADWVDRVETVLIYIGDQVFSRSDAKTNTLLRDGLLDRLANTPLDAWNSAERLFVAAAHLLFTAGRSIRFEEFNGRQLSATGLRDWLLDRWRRYAHATGTPLPDDLVARPAPTLAEEVAALAREVDRSDWIRFRRIRATAFSKHEALAELHRPDRTQQFLPEQVRRFAHRALGVALDAGLPGEKGVARTTEAILRQPGDAGAGLAHLLAVIVHSAVVELDADYAMSSAVRDPNRLAPAPQDPLREVLRLRKPDFFCCVLPHPRLAEHDLGRMLWLVAQRMQYNRWHFAPGNFDRTDVPRQRHYFFPPTLPDLAEFSDLWHGGHVAARVRYAIRAPGAPLWREPLSVGGNEFRGCFDIRAVRMHGRPFDRADLATAIRYSGLVDALWRTVVRCAADGVVAPVVTTFDRAWYERRGWAEVSGPRWT
ncbi:hypothetical protein [Micromonospora sp. NPDC049645]|uniref:hypothetical protein n=1 Tax=Micromonospora sp. NPDC049645 TaxID=3155508 RepID=UPI0034285661